MSKETNVAFTVSGIGCGLWLGMIVFFTWLSSMMFAYSIDVWFGKDLPTWVDWVCGFFLGEIMLFVWIASLIADGVSDSTPIFP